MYPSQDGNCSLPECQHPTLVELINDTTTQSYTFSGGEHLNILDLFFDGSSAQPSATSHFFNEQASLDTSPAIDISELSAAGSPSRRDFDYDKMDCDESTPPSLASRGSATGQATIEAFPVASQTGLSITETPIREETAYDARKYQVIPEEFAYDPRKFKFIPEKRPRDVFQPASTTRRSNISADSRDIPGPPDRSESVSDTDCAIKRTLLPPNHSQQDRIRDGSSLSILDTHSHNSDEVQPQTPRSTPMSPSSTEGHPKSCSRFQQKCLQDEAKSAASLRALAASIHFPPIYPLPAKMPLPESNPSKCSSISSRSPAAEQKSCHTSSQAQLQIEGDSSASLRALAASIHFPPIKPTSPRLPLPGSNRSTCPSSSSHDTEGQQRSHETPAPSCVSDRANPSASLRALAAALHFPPIDALRPGSRLSEDLSAASQREVSVTQDIATLDPTEDEKSDDLTYEMTYNEYCQRWARKNKLIPSWVKRTSYGQLNFPRTVCLSDTLRCSNDIINTKTAMALARIQREPLYQRSRPHYVVDVESFRRRCSQRRGPILRTMTDYALLSTIDDFSSHSRYSHRTIRELIESTNINMMLEAANFAPKFAAWTNIENCPFRKQELLNSGPDGKWGPRFEQTLENTAATHDYEISLPPYKSGFLPLSVSETLSNGKVIVNLSQRRPKGITLSLFDRWCRKRSIVPPGWARFNSHSHMIPVRSVPVQVTQSTRSISAWEAVSWVKSQVSDVQRAINDDIYVLHTTKNRFGAINKKFRGPMLQKPVALAVALELDKLVKESAESPFLTNENVMRTLRTNSIKRIKTWAGEEHCPLNAVAKNRNMLRVSKRGDTDETMS